MVIFRAIIVGNPTPEVTWTRNNGEINEERYKIIYDKSSGEHQLQVGSWPLTCMNVNLNNWEVLLKYCYVLWSWICWQIPDVSADEADTYKCFAKNEYGKAVVTAALNVIEGQSLNFIPLYLLTQTCSDSNVSYLSCLYSILVGYKKNKAMQQSRTGMLRIFSK